MDPEAQKLVINLLGSTYGELKKLDSSITTRSNTLEKRSDKLKEEITNIVKNIAPPPDVPAMRVMERIAPQAFVDTNQLQSQPPPVATYPRNEPLPVELLAATTPQTQPSDSNQLEFDLNKQTRYEDIINSIDRILERVNRLEDKIDQFIKQSTPKKKATQLNGGLNQ